ncbi:MAG: hypothetical protein L0Y80_00970 [Ignavibacteriae bacterium]|nr:hypothetical protein [Ignavibacteriota bacterium]
MPSRTELVMNDLVSEFQGVTIANGYRNDVKHVVRAIRPPQTMMEFPEIGIEFGKSEIVPKDDQRSLYDEIVEVTVVGVVAADLNAAQDPESANTLYDASESLAHDMRKKICTDILTKNINDAGNKWNVELSDNKLTVGRVMTLGAQRSTGTVKAQFKVRIRNVDPSFED